MKKDKFKLIFNKQTVAKVSIEQQKLVGGDRDTPTINDNCDHSIAIDFLKTYQNTYCVCNPNDWCGYNHETNCIGPAITEA